MKTIVTHADCVDGYLSALLLLECHPEADVIRRHHGDPDMEITEDVMFCDITPPAHQAAAFFEAGAKVLDHHKSAVPIFETKGAQGVYSAMPGVSGAVLAFEYARDFRWVLVDSRRAEVEGIATLVGIYDTWQEKSPRWQDALATHAALDLVMRDPSFVLRGADRALHRILTVWPMLLSMGRMLVTQSQQRAIKAASRAVLRDVELGGFIRRVACLVDPLTTAEMNLAAKMLDAELVLSAKFGEPKNQAAFAEEDVHCSLRAGRLGSDVDCAELAARLGGGGHKGAAGFAFNRLGPCRPVQFALARLVEAAYDAPPVEVEAEEVQAP